VESEYVDFGSNPGSLFANPANLASGFRNTASASTRSRRFPGATSRSTEAWRYSGARDIFAANPVLPLGDNTRSTRVRYGLGMRYDFTKSLGIRAELERYSPLGSPSPESSKPTSSRSV
jgi:hypothetical protein